MWKISAYNPPTVVKSAHFLKILAGYFELNET